MPCCVLQHPETKDFVPFLEAAEEDGEGRTGDQRCEMDRQGVAFERVETNLIHPNRIMFIFSVVPFIFIHFPPPSICMKLKIVAVYYYFFPPRDHVFKQCLLQSFTLSCLNSAVTPRRAPRRTDLLLGPRGEGRAASVPSGRRCGT